MSVSSGPSQQFPVRFTGERRIFGRLVARGSLLLMVTLGIYRFWLTTDIRRFFWSNTDIAGESLEYSGTPLELLIGFLFALALLVPVYVAFFIAALDIGVLGQLSGTLGFLLLFALGQYAVFRARRYRLSRTILRGLRFHQEGSAIRYAVCALFWWGITLLTCGLAYPWKAARLERYKMRHSYYGDLQGRFEGLGFGLLLRGLPLWLLVVIPIAAALTAIGQSFDADVISDVLAKGGDDALARIAARSPDLANALVFAFVCASLAGALALLCYPAFHAMTLRWWLSGLRFGSVEMRSRLRTTQIYGGYLRFAGWVLLYAAGLLAFGVPLLLLTTFLLGGKDVSILRELFVSLIGLGAYVVAMLGLSAIYRATVMFTVWKSAAETLEISNLDALSEVRAAGRASSAVGEGLADALHVGGI